MLRDQHSRPRFDIHDYGTRLLDTLSIEVAKNVVVEQEKRRQMDEGRGSAEGEEGEEPDEDVQGSHAGGISDDGGGVGPNADVMSEPFVAIAAKQQASRYEVCRLFLSMLQLANDRNVELSHETANSEGMDELPTLDAVADRLTDSLRVKLLSMAKAVDMVEHPGMDHVSASEPLDDDEELNFVTQVTQEQDFGMTPKHAQSLVKSRQGVGIPHRTGKSGISGIGASILDEESVEASSSSKGGPLEPAQSKMSMQKRTAMGDLENQSMAALGSRF